MSADASAEELDGAWQCFAMTFDHERQELTGWLNGVAGDRWLENPKQDYLISSAYNASMQGPFARLPGVQEGEDETFPKDQYDNPPEGEPLTVEVLREEAGDRVERREYRYTRIEVMLRHGQEVSRELVALRLNPWWFPHALSTPPNDGSGGPFTIGRVIHSSRTVGFTGWIGGVAVFSRALSAAEQGRFTGRNRCHPRSVQNRDRQAAHRGRSRGREPDERRSRGQRQPSAARHAGKGKPELRAEPEPDLFVLAPPPADCFRTPKRNRVSRHRTTRGTVGICTSPAAAFMCSGWAASRTTRPRRSMMNIPRSATAPAPISGSSPRRGGVSSAVATRTSPSGPAAQSGMGRNTSCSIPSGSTPPVTGRGRSSGWRYPLISNSGNQWTRLNRCWGWTSIVGGRNCCPRCFPRCAMWTRNRGASDAVCC